MFSRRLRQRLNVWIKEENKLRVNKRVGCREKIETHLLWTEKEVLICEPDQGQILDEEMVDERQGKSILESSVLHWEEVPTLKASRETKESQIFQTNCF